MRALLVTSKVTFIRNNYDGLVLEMAKNPNIAGILVLDNSNYHHILQGVAVCFVGAFRTGVQLVRNQIFDHSNLRKKAFEENGKFYKELKTINCEDALNLVSSEKIDLIVNARTRYIYKSNILMAPRLRCINVHHGILPEQRGTMCDLWALSEGRPAGFTIHQMNHKIDDGGIVRSNVVPIKEKNYQKYLKASAQLEAKVLAEVLDSIAKSDRIEVQPNITTPKKHYRNPGFKQIMQMQLKGMKL